MGGSGGRGGGEDTSLVVDASASRGGCSPCGACKFLRRKCEKSGCIFAPYFGAEHQAQFEAVHKIFGASNVSKMLQRIPLPELRRQAVATISFEAQARMSDPIYGCIAHIFALEHQVANLQAELALVQTQLANCTLMASSTPSQFQQQQHQLISSHLYGYNGSTNPITNTSLISPSHDQYSSMSASSCCNSNDTTTNAHGRYVGRVKDENGCGRSNMELFPSNYHLSLANSCADNNSSDTIMLHEPMLNEQELQALANALLLQKSYS